MRFLDPSFVVSCTILQASDLFLLTQTLSLFTSESIVYNPDHRLNLAFSLNALDITLSIAEQSPVPENEVKWKAVGSRALSSNPPQRSGRMSML